MSDRENVFLMTSGEPRIAAVPRGASKHDVPKSCGYEDIRGGSFHRTGAIDKAFGLPIFRRVVPVQ